MAPRSPVVLSITNASTTTTTCMQEHAARDHYPDAPFPFTKRRGYIYLTMNDLTTPPTTNYAPRTQVSPTTTVGNSGSKERWDNLGTDMDVDQTVVIAGLLVPVDELIRAALACSTTIGSQSYWRRSIGNQCPFFWLPTKPGQPGEWVESRVLADMRCVVGHMNMSGIILLSFQIEQSSCSYGTLDAAFRWWLLCCDLRSSKFF
jgi:hypothetical protein